MCVQVKRAILTRNWWYEKHRRKYYVWKRPPVSHQSDSYPAITSSKLAIKTVAQGVKYVQS